jgi:O-acetyl-ADP-ribose deacetylase (regulator of RNase III)
MITYVKGSLFESPAKVLVNTVNTVGVMGKGVAKIFRQIYPEMFSQYQRVCERKQLQVGKLWLYKTDHKWILNFPTKIHWRQPSKPEYVEAGLKAFVASYSTQGISSIAFPKLACGNGELDWPSVVRPMMTKYLGNLAIDVFIHEYGEDYTVPEHKDIEVMTAWLRSEPRALAFSEMWDDLRAVIGPGLELKTWGGTASFKVFVTTQPEEGLRMRVGERKVPALLASMLTKIIPAKWRPQIIGPEDIFVPQEAILDLWQNTRAYGFCVPRIMPAGLDVLAPYVLALLSRLKYLKPVELSFQSRRISGIAVTGLRLYALPMAARHESAERAYAVHPA